MSTDAGGAADVLDAEPGAPGPAPVPPARTAPGGRPGRAEEGAAWSTPATTWVLRASAVALVACVAVFGSVVAVRTPVPSPVDEGAHFAYVQYIAQHGSVPVLGHHYASLGDLELDPSFSTRRWGTDPRDMGLLGLGYEDFQPPLYYALAVPAYDLGGSLHAKVIAVRFFDLVLLGAAVAALARLARRVMGRRWLVGFTAGMLVLAMPGVVVRSVTVSNTSLLVLLTIACVTELWIARHDGRSVRLVTAGVLVGLALLTNLFAVVLVPVYALVAAGILWRSRSRRDLAMAGAGAAVALVVMAPWLVFNLVEYHALTATSLARSEQLATVNPGHLAYGFALVANETGSWLVSPVVPQEWTVMGHPILVWLNGLLEVAVVPGALLLGLSMGRRVVTAGTWVLVTPWALTLVLCAAVTYVGQWPTELSRYTYPTLPLLALFGAVGAVSVVRDRWLIPVTAALLAAGTVALWIGFWPQVPVRVPGS